MMLGAASVGSLCSGIALCAPPPERLEKEIVVTATRPQDAELAAKVTTASSRTRTSSRITSP